ncbi:MAG: hypothetical protein Q9188_002504 [Gyalolechia gomerana]
MVDSSQQPTSTATFPFEKLPQEVQTMVLREAMPQHGLLPRNSRRLMEVKGDYQNAIPHNLFRVNKAISAEARCIAKKEVYLVIEVSPDNAASTDAINVLSLNLKGLANFWSHTALTDFPHFRKLSNFKLDLMTDNVRPWFHVDQVYFDCSDYKEKLRLVCDALATNNNIQHIIVQIPCLCSLRADDTVHIAQSKLLDFLSPLRRLKVAQPVDFRITHGTDHWGEGTDDPNITENLKHLLKANFGDLVGEKLSKEETLWKNIKARDRTELHEAAEADVDYKLWELFETLNDYPENFERHVRRVKKYWSRKLRKHRRGKEVP